MPAYRYKRLEQPSPPAFLDKRTNPPYALQYPFQQGAAKLRILFIIEHVPTEDLKSGKLLNGPTGDLFGTVVRRAADAADVSLRDVTWLAVNWNCWKTYDKGEGFKAESNEWFAKRMRKIIQAFEPDRIVVFGNESMRYLLPNMYERGYLKYNFYGVPMPMKVGNSRVPTTCCIHLSNIVQDDDRRGNGPSNLIGYLIRNTRNALLGRNPYRVDISDFKSIKVSNMSGFESLMDRLDAAKCAAFDTETDGLGRVSSKMLSIQFAVNSKAGFFVPLYHKDTPFKARELDTIVQQLRNWYEKAKRTKYLIAQNGPFDLSQVYTNIKPRFIKPRVWDISHAEFVLDENNKFLAQKGKGRYFVGLPEYGNMMGGYYSLANLLAQYSSFEYETTEFQKGDRATIAEVPLDKHLVRYGNIDAVGPFAIHERQQQQADDLKYEKFRSMVLDQESDKVHSFGTMEHTGIPIDLHYLFYLKTQDSPIERQIKEQFAKLANTKAGRRLNKKLIRENGIPQKSLFGGETVALDLSKTKHKLRLFFDELELEPVAYGKDGKTPSLGKSFKEEYKDKVPEVAMFDDIGKAEKLRDAFVNQFIRLFEEGGDIRVDQRVRPNFTATQVVTGRVAESNPNMQQIPTRSALGKHIKRLFVAIPRHILIKCDYVAHEVRGWSIISGDTVLGEVFARGLNLRVQYMHHPTKELAELIFLEGDSHRLNVAYFFKVDLKKIDREKLKELRDQIKQIIFGLIYGKGNATLAGDLDLEEEEVDKLVSKLFARFSKGARWLTHVEETGRKNLYVESPLGRRRNLWSHLVPKSAVGARKIHSAADRKARNSPIQGMCSDFNFISCRNLTELAWLRTLEAKRPVQFQLLNVVHDSCESMSGYDDFWWSIKAIKRSMTTDVARIVEERHGYKFTVPLEIDMEFGPSFASMSKWEWDGQGLAFALANTFLLQEREHGHDIQPYKELKSIFKRHDEMPKFLIKQFKNVGEPDLKAALKKAAEKYEPSEYVKRNKDTEKEAA